MMLTGDRGNSAQSPRDHQITPAPKKRHDYRIRVICKLPWLKQLDSVTITSSEVCRLCRLHKRSFPALHYVAIRY
jgi:hypothetical protein